MPCNMVTYSEAGSSLVNGAVAWDGTLLGEITLRRTCGKLTVGHGVGF